MSYELNDKIKNLVPYEPVSGNYDIRLDANECAVNYTPELFDMVHSAVDKLDFNRYPDPSCIELRKSFAKFYGIDYKNVTVGNGSDELIYLIESAFLQKGEKMLAASPDFSMYEFYANISENPCVKFFKNRELNIDVDSLIETVNKEDIKLLIFSNPCNPTGQGISRQNCVKLLNSVNALTVLDEAYMDFWDDDESLIKDVNSYDNLIVLRTASKAMGSAALRLGFAAANENISRALAAVKSPYNVNSFSQAVATELYKNKNFLINRMNSIVENTKFLYNELLRVGGGSDDFRVYPTKTNFVFVKTSFGKELWEYLKDNSIAIRYMGEFIRITSGTRAENSMVIKAIEKYFWRNSYAKSTD